MCIRDSFLAFLTLINITRGFKHPTGFVFDYISCAALGYSNVLYMNLPIIVHKLFEVTIMSRSAQGIILLLLSVLAVSFLVSYAVIPTSATTIVQLQPNTVSSGDRVYVTANLAENSSTVILSYYADLNKNCLLYTSPSPRDRPRSR